MRDACAARRRASFVRRMRTRVAPTHLILSSPISARLALGDFDQGEARNFLMAMTPRQRQGADAEDYQLRAPVCTAKG